MLYKIEDFFNKFTLIKFEKYIFKDNLNAFKKIFFRLKLYS